MREQASKVGGSGAAQLSAAEPSVGKETLVEHAAASVGPPAGAAVQSAATKQGAAHGSEQKHALAEAGPHSRGPREGESERLAEAGERLLDGVAEMLQKLADTLSDYSDAGAERGKEELEQLLETCGPGTVNINQQVQVQADKLTNFYFAKLMRAAAIQARNMAKACGELHKQLHEHKDGAIAAFLGKAIFSAGELLIEFGQFNLEVGVVTSLVAQIGARCGRPVELHIPQALKPHVLTRPKFQFHINPQLSPDGGLFTIPGLKIPGGHTILPHGLSVPHGPVTGQYVA